MMKKTKGEIPGQKFQILKSKFQKGNSIPIVIGSNPKLPITNYI